MDIKQEDSIESVNNDLKAENERAEQLAKRTNFEVMGQELLHSIYKNLVDDEDSVRIDVMVGEQTTVFELRVARSDLGRVIGKKGQIATAVRKILNSFATKHRKRAVLEIVE